MPSLTGSSNEREPIPQQDIPGRRRLSAFGVTIASEHPFTFNLATVTGAPELTFDCVGQAPLRVDWDDSSPLYATREQMPTGESAGAIVRLPDCYVLRFLGAADFFVWPDRIVCHLRDPDYAFAVEIWLLGTVLAFWLEQRGIPALHAASVEVEGRCIAFLATNKGGKSSLAASFLQAGHRLVGDDILPLERRDGLFLGRPGYPQMRLWPEQARYFAGSDAGLKRVHPRLEKLRVPIGANGFGEFASQAGPVAGLYLPERHERDEIEIEALPLSEALPELLRQSFLSTIIETTGLEAQRFRFFAGLLREVPVKRLRYPSGNHHLPSVRDALLNDLGSTS
ncbi:MAG: hypothetical protein WD273_05820 [Trueperaceae bacterium]